MPSVFLSVHHCCTTGHLQVKTKKGRISWPEYSPITVRLAKVLENSWVWKGDTIFFCPHVVISCISLCAREKWIALCKCVDLHCLCESSAFWYLWPCQFVHFCESIVCPYVTLCVLLTVVWFIPFFSDVAVWGPLCVMPMHRGLYVIAVGLWKPPAIWTPAALDLSVHPSITFNCSEPGFCAVAIYWAVSP